MVESQLSIVYHINRIMKQRKGIFCSCESVDHFLYYIRGVLYEENNCCDMY